MRQVFRLFLEASLMIETISESQVSLKDNNKSHGLIPIKLEPAGCLGARYDSTGLEGPRRQLNTRGCEYFCRTSESNQVC